MKTRIIYTDFYMDDYILSLPVKEKYLFIFLLTNPQVSLSGMYKISNRIITLCCGITDKELETIKQKFIKDGKFFFFKDWVKILNYENYNNFKGEKNLKALSREMSSIPSEVIQYRYSIDTLSTTRDTPINHKSEIINHKPVIKENIVSHIRYLENIPLKDLEEITKKFRATPPQIKHKAEALINYCKAKGKIYRDYRALLENALEKDYGRRESKGYEYIQ